MDAQIQQRRYMTAGYNGSKTYGQYRDLSADDLAVATRQFIVAYRMDPQSNVLFYETDWIYMGWGAKLTRRYAPWSLSCSGGL
jgi:hypothetical protein